MCAGPVNLLFYPPENNSYHFRTKLPTVFKDRFSHWAYLNYEENKTWGRIWINPTFNLADLNKVFDKKG